MLGRVLFHRVICYRTLRQLALHPRLLREDRAVLCRPVTCDAPLHGVMETIQNDAKECLGCLLTLDAGRGREDSSWELSEGVARLLV